MRIAPVSDEDDANTFLKNMPPSHVENMPWSMWEEHPERMEQDLRCVRDAIIKERAEELRCVRKRSRSRISDVFELDPETMKPVGKRGRGGASRSRRRRRAAEAARR